MNDLVKRQLEQLSRDTVEQMKIDYRQGTGLTLWDLSRKYKVRFATCFYVVRGK